MSEPIPCAHDICTRPAIVRQKLATGWANLCLFHYKYHADEVGRAFAEKMGFKTGEDSRHWALERLGSIGKPSFDSIVTRWRGILSDPEAPPIARSMAAEALNNLKVKPLQREPGQDDEEMQATQSVAHSA